MSYVYNSNGWQRDAKTFLSIYKKAVSKGKEYYKFSELMPCGDSWENMDYIYKLEELGIIKCIDKSGSTQNHLYITLEVNNG